MHQGPSPQRPPRVGLGGAGWGLGREVLTVESLKDVPGRKGRPCTGLDTIAAAFAAATWVAWWPHRLPGRRAASADLAKLHGNAKHPERRAWGWGRGLRRRRDVCARAPPAGPAFWLRGGSWWAGCKEAIAERLRSSR